MANPHRSPPADDALKASITKRIKDGLSIREVAESLGRSRGQINRVIAEMGGKAEILRAG